VQILTAFASALIGALIGVLSIMLITSLFIPHAFKLPVATGIACGAALANAIRASSRKVSPNAFTWLIVCLVSAGGMVGERIAGPH
jgi:hypothetical protein